MKTLSAFTYQKHQQARKQQHTVKIALFLVVWFIVLGMTVFHGSVAVGESRMPQTVVVGEGDTLWSIAQNNLPRRTDIRNYIEQIRKMNQLDSAVIYPGQVLDLP